MAVEPLVMQTRIAFYFAKTTIRTTFIRQIAMINPENATIAIHVIRAATFSGSSVSLNTGKFL